MDQSVVTEMVNEYHRRFDIAYTLIQAIPHIDIVKTSATFYTFLDVSELVKVKASKMISNCAAI